MAEQNQDAELVAIWLHGAAREAGQLETLRELIRRAASQASEMYSAPDEEQQLEPADEFGVRGALARFAAKWDECERIAREDEQAG